MTKGSSSNNAPQFDPSQSQVNAFLPTGDLRYGTVGGGGQFVPKTGGEAYKVAETPGAAQFRRTYEDLGQSIIGRGQGLLGQLGQQVPGFGGLPEYRSEIDYSGISPVTRPEDFGAEGQRLEEATFQRAMGLLNPEFERQDEALYADLAARGIPVEVGNVGASPAAQQGIRDLRETQGELRNRAAFDAVGAGRQYQSDLFGQGLASRGAQMEDQLRDIALQNQARQAGFGERTAVRQNVLNELAQMLQGPQIQAAVPIQDNTFAGQNLAYQGQLNQYNQQQARQNQAMGGLFGLAGAGLGGALAGGYF